MLDKVLAAILSISPVSSADIAIPYPLPEVNLSAVRHIVCKEGSGSGFMIADNVIATALHVAKNSNCVDGETGAKLMMYNADPAHDFALMTGRLPDMPYIKYSCSGYVEGKTIIAYGISSYGSDLPILRAETMKVDGKDGSLRNLSGGRIVFGMSGGPHIQNGRATGLSNFTKTRDYIVIRAILPYASSYELKDTTLCKPLKDPLR